MKFIPLHTRNTSIVYKNSLCSSATVIVLVFVMLSVMLPVLLVSLLSPYSGIAESRILYEQPRLQFKFQNLFVAETETRANDAKGTSQGLVACSTFATFNNRMQAYGKHCEGSKYWTEDLDNDGRIDRAHFQLQLESMAGRITSFDLALFFDAELQHKCALSPPALLTHRLLVPASAQLASGIILLKAELQLKQHVEFTCPFLGRNTKTPFRDVVIHTNASSSKDIPNISHFQLEPLLQQLKTNPAYFQMKVQETYFRHDQQEQVGRLLIQLELDVLQVPARYHLSVWERLGQFWLYFASFFGISFYVMNKLKDFLFGHHIIRSWEIIPWKKLY